METSVAPQAHLQRRLLTVLSESPAQTVTEAAIRADASRVSASRSLHMLLERGLVEKQRRSWALTDAGRNAADELLAEPSASVRALGHTAGQQANWHRSLGLEAAAATRALSGLDSIRTSALFSAGLQAKLLREHDTIVGLAKRITADVRPIGIRTSVLAAEATADMRPLSLGIDSFSAKALADFVMGLGRVDLEAFRAQSPLFELSKRLAEQAAYPTVLEEVTRGLRKTLAMPGLLAAANLAAPSAELQKAIRAATESVRVSATGALNSALSEAIDVQRTQLQVLAAGSNARAWWTPMIAESLRPTASLVSDLAAMEGLVGSRREMVRRLSAPLGIASASVVAAQGRHLTAALAGLATAPPSYASSAVQSLIVPAVGSAAFVGGARRFLEPPPRRRDEPDVDVGARTRDLAERLAAIHPPLAEMLLGAWERLRLGGHDWTRQAAQSAREVLTQTLERLAPDAPPDPAAQNKVTHAARVRYLLARSGTLANWAEAQVEAVDTAYRLLVAEAHEHDATRVNREGMAGVLRSVEAVLWVVVSVRIEELASD